MGVARSEKQVPKVNQAVGQALLRGNLTLLVLVLLSAAAWTSMVLARANGAVAVAVGSVGLVLGLWTGRAARKWVWPVGMGLILALLIVLSSAARKGRSSGRAAGCKRRRAWRCRRTGRWSTWCSFPQGRRLCTGMYMWRVTYQCAVAWLRSRTGADDEPVRRVLIVFQPMFSARS